MVHILLKIVYEITGIDCHQTTLKSYESKTQSKSSQNKEPLQTKK